MRSRKVAALAFTACIPLALSIGACTGSSYGNTSSAAGATATTAGVVRIPGATASATTELTPDAFATRTVVAAPATTPSATAAPPAPAAPAPPAAQLTVVASGVRFQQSALTAPAGLVTITFDNRDDGVSHDLHVFSGSDASGAEVGSTEIHAGVVQQTLALGTLAAGTYFYQCDVHPSRMMGTLTVS